MSLENYIIHITNVKFISLSKRWFTSIENYNQLKISKYFYKIFLKYDYLLTYELDSFVFTNQLSYWCELGYDYIGAPWFDGYLFGKVSEIPAGVGNSGFSLRRTKKCYDILSKFKTLPPFKYSNFKIPFVKRSSPRLFMMKVKLFNFLSIFWKDTYIQNLYTINEDIFWCDIVANSNANFKIAPFEEAYKFSFEVNPKLLYHLNNEQLPFGCHAWTKYDSDFWKIYINGSN